MTPPMPDQPGREGMAIADELDEFAARVLGTMSTGLSPTGAATAIALLVSLKLPVIQEAADALRTLDTSRETDRG